MAFSLEKDALSALTLEKTCLISYRIIQVCKSIVIALLLHIATTIFNDNIKTIRPRSNCPISYATDLLRDRWTLLILRDMIFYDKSSYSEFLNSTEKIASNILNDRLHLLQREGFVTKRTAPKNQSKFLYSLTGKAIALIPMMLELIEWGSTYSTFGAPKVLTKNSLENAGLDAEIQLS